MGNQIPKKAAEAEFALEETLKLIAGLKPIEKLQKLGFKIHYESEEDKFGALREAEDDAPFKWKGQKHYDLVADIVNEYV